VYNDIEFETQFIVSPFYFVTANRLEATSALNRHDVRGERYQLERRLSQPRKANLGEEQVHLVSGTVDLFT